MNDKDLKQFLNIFEKNLWFTFYASLLTSQKVNFDHFKEQKYLPMSVSITRNEIFEYFARTKFEALLNLLFSFPSKKFQRIDPVFKPCSR